MHNILDIAKAVSFDAILRPWDPVVSFSPEFELKDIEEKKCCIVPIDTEYKLISRSAKEIVYTIDVGFLFRAKRLNVGNLLLDISKYAPQFIGKRYDELICKKAVHKPLFDVEGIRTASKFTAVIELTFSEVDNGR